METLYITLVFHTTKVETCRKSSNETSEQTTTLEDNLKSQINKIRNRGSNCRSRKNFF